MRKYVQVVLVILSVFSLVSLLVYRHEYNKLRYVLQVLNFFGTPGGANVTCKSNIGYNFRRTGLPPPGWHRVSNNLHVYSAFYDESDVHNGVKAIALGVLNENLAHGCYLWYENHNAPVKGEFSFSAIPRNNQQTYKNNLNSKYFPKPTKNKGYWFYCKAVKELLKPIGVTFYKTNNDDTAQAYLPVKSIDKTKGPLVNRTTVCVMPRDTPFLDNHKYLEFFAYHNIIGIKDFILYGGEYAQPIMNTLDQDPASSISIISLQWNFPFVVDYELMRSLAEADCLVRSKQTFGVAVSLAWNQFLVPKFHSSLPKLISDYNPEGNIDKFQLPVIIFCLEYKDDPKAPPELPAPFKKSRYAFPRSNVTVSINQFHTQGTVVQQIKREMAAVHWYTKCDTFDLKVADKTEPKYDHSILRFKTDLLQSDILRLTGEY